MSDFYSIFIEADHLIIVFVLVAAILVMMRLLIHYMSEFVSSRIDL